MRARNYRPWAQALICVLVVAGGAFAQDLKGVLSQKILTPDRTTNETRSFVEARITKMPSVKSLDEWVAIETAMRDRALKEVVFKGKADAWRTAPTKVEWMGTIDGPGYKIRKLRFEALPGFWVPSLLYEPANLKGKRVPVVLNVNGHDRVGKAADYKQMRCINLAKRGILAMNVEWIGMGQLNIPENLHWQINHVDLCGAGGVGTHYLVMSRALDILLAHDHADPQRTAVTGLSGGGWQTIFFSAFDTRVKLTVPVAGYSSYFTRARFPSDLGDSEQTPVDLGMVTDYAPMTAMMGGRAALLVFNEKDNCCFASPHALAPLMEASAPIFKLYGREKFLRSHTNSDPGTHNYLLDNRQALYKMVGDVFYPGDTSFSPKEIPSEPEIKTATQLDVELPPNNLTLHKLAQKLSEGLPAAGQSNTANLLKVLRADKLDARGTKGDSTTKDDLTTTRWKFTVGLEWTLPALEITGKKTDKGTALVLCDQGKAGASAVVDAYVKNGYRVVALDIYNTGECTFPTHAYLWSLFVATVGERPLGVQAAQIGAVARALAVDGKPVVVVADGPRTTTAALCAAALEKMAIGELDLRNALSSLKTLIDQSVPYEKAPELFCFGLLEVADIPQLVKLSEPRPVKLQTAADPFPAKK